MPTALQNMKVRASKAGQFVAVAEPSAAGWSTRFISAVPPTKQQASELAEFINSARGDVATLAMVVEAIASKSHPLTCKGCRTLLEMVASLVRERAPELKVVDNAYGAVGING